MHDFVRPRLLRFLRVPHDPDPPAGAPGSLRVFRGGRNLYKLRLLRWGLGQVGALVGIAFSLGFLNWADRSVDAFRTEIRQTEMAEAARARKAAELAKANPPPEAPASDVAVKAEPAKDAPATAKSKSRKDRTRNSLKRVVERWPVWIFPLLGLLEVVGIAIYLIQIPITLTLVRLDFELRWYMVTDRSLRIRNGVATIHEATMSFANIQQVVVSQGPLQRLLGLADVRVRSAGGGGSQEESADVDSMHTGVFHGVDNANEIRDLILARLRTFRAAGLGDPDDAHHTPNAEGSRADPGGSAATAAAKELLAEARTLRQVLGRPAAS